MSEETHMRIRVSDDLRNQLIDVAEKNGRSLTAEVIARLEESLAKGVDASSMASRIAALEAAVTVLQKDTRQLYVNDDHLLAKIENVYKDAGI
jgi:hypothetical protein